MEEVQKNENGTTVPQADGKPKKEDKPKRELTPQQVQQRRKMIVFPLMFLAFAGCMYLIFAPSGKEDVNVESVGGFNADIPLPAEDGIIADKQKAYEQAAKYMNDGGQNGQTAQVPVAGTVTQMPQAQPVQAIRETTVSGLQQPMSDADFIRAYSQPRNYGFNTAVGTGYAMGKNTVAACIHQDQTLMDGQAVKLRLLEPMQAGNIVVPKNTLVAGTAKVQGERLDIVVSSIEYAGNIIPVELAVFDTDGQKGLSVPSSMEQEAFNEAMANIGSGLGTSISFAQSAGQQVAMDVTRGLLQGTSGYLAKKFRTVKVKLKAGYKVMLYAKQQ